MNNLEEPPATTIARPIVVFVGGFSAAARDGALGGQAYASQALIHSPLQFLVQWVLIDSTQKSLPPPPWIERAWYAVRRLAAVAMALAKPVGCVLLFSSFSLAAIWEKGLMCLMARLRGVRVVWSVRSQIPLVPRPTVKTRLVRAMLGNASVVLCQTEQAAERIGVLLNEFPGEIVCVPNWIDCSEYPARPSRSGVTTFLFLGWCELSKGIRDLIHAAQSLDTEGVAFRLNIAGGGSQLPWVEDACERMQLAGQVSVHGWVSGEAKTELLQGSDVLVLPSYSEGLPNAILEAMASGLAIIATTVGGIPSVVESGRNGILVPPGDVPALATAMKALAESPAKVREYGLYNALQVRRRHDISVISPLIAKLLGVGDTGVPLDLTRQHEHAPGNRQ